MKKLNVKLLVILLVSTVLFFGGVKALHSFQLGRTASSLQVDAAAAWEDAKAYKESEDPDDDTLLEKLERASEMHKLYVNYRGNDAVGRATWALISSELIHVDDLRMQGTHFTEAVQRSEGALTRPTEGLDEAGLKLLDDVRRWLVGAYMSQRHFEDALEHLAFLVQKHPEDLDLKRLQAECRIGLQQHDRAAEALRAIIAEDPTQVHAYFRLAAVLTDRLDKPEEAEAVIEAAVAANPNSFEVYLARAGRFRMAGETEKAKEDILTALSYADGADDARVILMAAEIAMAAEDSDMAREQLLRGVRLHPENEHFYRHLYFLELMEKDRDAAIQWLERGMEKNRRSPELRMQYAEQMLQSKELERARESIEKLREMRAGVRGHIPYLEGRLAMHERKWVEARKKMEEARQTLSEAMIRQIDMHLAHCHQKLGQTGEALRIYDRLVVTYPTMLNAHVFRARLLYDMKRWDDSYQGYKNVVNAIGIERFIDGFGDWGRLHDLAGRTGDADMKRRIAEYVGSSESGDAATLLANVQLLMIQKKEEDARQLLEEFLLVHPDEERVWLVLANVATRAGTVEDGLAILDRAEKALGDSTLLQLTRTRYVSFLPAEQAQPRLAELAKAAERLEPAARENAYKTLADAYLRLGETGEAVRFLNLLTEMAPNDPKVLLALLELELGRGNRQQAQDVIDRIRSRLGRNSEYTHFAQAVRLINEIGRKPDEDNPLTEDETRRLDDASRFIELAKKERPNWHDATRLEARIADLRGEDEIAVDRYLEAVHQGERSPPVLQLLVAKLFEAKRIEEIEEIIQLLRDTPGSEAIVEGWDALITGGNDYTKIIEKLRQAVSENPDDVNKNFQLAQLLVLAEKYDEAKQSLRRVLELNDGSADLAWPALVQVLMKLGEEEEAEQVTAEAKTKLPAARAHKILPRCYELLGDMDQAEQAHLAAHQHDPSDLAALRSLVTFYVQMANRDREHAADHLQKAAERLQQLIATGTKVDPHSKYVRWARRVEADRLAGMLSLMVPAERSYERFKEALALLAANTREGEEPLVADRLMKATVMGMRNEKSFRRDAVAEFEAISSQQELRPEEMYSLANLYEAVGRWDDCRQTMMRLLRRKPEVKYLSQMIHMILRNDNPRDDGTASSYLVQLKQLSPDSHITAIAEARYLIATQREDEGIERMQRLIPRPPDPDKPEQILILRDVALYLEQMDQIEAAEELWREYMANQPSAALGLAAYLGRHGKLDEAFDLCDEQLARNGKLLGQVIQVGLNSIRNEMSTASSTLAQRHFDRVDGWFEQAVQAYPDAPALKLQRAELYNIHGRYDDAENLYRALVNDSQTPLQFNAVAQNNLAYLLALRHKGGGSGHRALVDAQSMIDGAIAVRGLTSDLLDTRGMVHLAQNNFQQAIADLQVSVDENPSGSKWFHLAWAYDKAGQQDMVADAMNRAIEDYGLELGQLGQLEREEFSRLVALLETETE